MTGISYFCIKPLVLSRLECTQHAVWPTWGHPPPSKQRQKSEDAVFLSLDVHVFVVVLFQDIANYVTRMCTKFWILERFRTYTIDEDWKVSLITYKVIFLLVFTDN